MKLWKKYREWRDAKRAAHDREAEGDLEARMRGEVTDPDSYRRDVLHDQDEEGHPSAGARRYIPRQ